MTNITYTDDKIEIIKSVINSDSVSLEQIGMVTLLLFGDFETVNTRSIINSVSNGQTTVTKSMKALESMNVLSKNRRMANGRFSVYEYVLSKANSTSLSSPCVVKQHMVETHMDSSYADKLVCETDKIDMSYNNIYNNISSYDDISIISYPYRDSDDMIDNTNTNEDLFLKSLSNPISYPTCPSNFTENNKSNEIDTRRAYEDYRDVTCNEQVDNVNAKSQINCAKSQVSCVKSQICYDILINDHKEDKDLIDLISNIMSETYASVSPCTRISGKFVATRNVVTWLMKLGKDDIEYVVDCVKNNSREIRSIKPYLLTSLYNAAANQDNRKLSEKYGNGKSKKETKNDKCHHSTFSMELYEQMVEEQSKLFEKLGAGEITMEEFKKMF